MSFVSLKLKNLCLLKGERRPLSLPSQSVFFRLNYLMKKFFCFVLSILTVMSLTACGGSSSVEPSVEKQSVQQTDNAVTAQSSSSDEIVVVDNEYCKVSFIGFEEDVFGQNVCANFSLQNKTSYHVEFIADATAVNGWLCPAAALYTGIPANCELTQYLQIPLTELQDAGVQSVDKIEFYLRAYNDDIFDDNGARIFYINDFFVIYPTGLTEAEVVSPEKRQGANEKVLISNDICLFEILEAYDDENSGYTVVAYAENKHDKPLHFKWSDTSINGCNVKTFGALLITPGNKCITKWSFCTDDLRDYHLEENNISSIDDAEFSFVLTVDDRDSSFVYRELLSEAFTY